MERTKNKVQQQKGQKRKGHKHRNCPKQNVTQHNNTTRIIPNISGRKITPKLASVHGVSL